MAVQQDKVQSIIAVSREAFARYGYKGVTIRAIAQEANVSTRTIYNHFPDKLAIFKACIQMGGARLPRPEVQDGTDLRATLIGFAYRLHQHLTSEHSLEISKIIYREGGIFPEISAASRKNYEDHVVAPLSDYLASLGLEAEEAEWRAILFCNMTSGELQRHILFHDPLLNDQQMMEQVEKLVDVFLHGLSRTSLSIPSSPAK